MLVDPNTLPDNGIVHSHTSVKDEWLDYNDHMNVAYYVAAFDIGVDETKATFGMTEEYIQRTKLSTVALEAHIRYLREAMAGEQLRIETRIVDYDHKRIHYYQEMYRDDELLATHESLGISFDLEQRRTNSFPDTVTEGIQEMHRRQAQLAPPEAVGSRVGIRRK